MLEITWNCFNVLPLYEHGYGFCARHVCKWLNSLKAKAIYWKMFVNKKKLTKTLSFFTNAA